MTFRAKPVVKRSHRPGWEARDRRNLLMNLGFGLVVLVAVVILALAAGASWYDAHLSPVAAVNGQSITKDQFNQRYRIELYRLDIAERRLNTEHAAGRLTDSEWTGQVSFVSSARSSAAQQSLEDMIDARIQADLATQEGITVGQAQIDAQITKEATSPEQRHAWIIEVKPKVDTGKTLPTDAQKADASKIADKALADLVAGKKWQDVAKVASTHSSAATGGDLGWISADSAASLDPSFGDAAFKDAMFKLAKDGRTPVLVGTDGTYRIGQVTEIVPETVDASYRQQLADDGIPRDAYDAVVRTDLIRIGLQDKIKTQALASGLQRRVAQIFIKAPSSGTPPTDAIKVRHILYSPNNDPQKAATLAPTDPAWKKAEDEARATYAKLKADPSQFDAIARKDSDESGDDVSGGKLPYFDPSMTASGQLDAAFGGAIFKAGLKAGDILEPVRSAFGWHVIQVMYFPPDLDQANKLKTQAERGADFAQLARDNSNAPEAAKGGDLGWIAHYQLDQKSSDAIFATPIGKTSDPVVIDGDGIHIYKVLEEATRTPDGDQKATLEQSAFTNWYDAKKATFTIRRDVGFSTPTG
ncbi:MAG: peptidylprolyl isomerase [Chloroflexota bacterium]|nr:peptidylprolyl isomerase [Chloroflexota bacterium]